MSHIIHILTNAQSEAYVIVSKTRYSVDYLNDRASDATDHYQKRNPILFKFVQNSVNLEIEYHYSPELSTHEDVLEYRQHIIDQYEADGYLVVDEKTDKTLDSPADANFSEVLSRISDTSAWIKHYGRDELIKARKSLSVREVLANYPWPK